MTQSMKAELLSRERWEDEGGATMGIEPRRITGSGRFVRSRLKTAWLHSGDPQAMEHEIHHRTNSDWDVIEFFGKRSTEE